MEESYKAIYNTSIPKGRNMLRMSHQEDLGRHLSRGRKRQALYPRRFHMMTSIRQDSLGGMMDTRNIVVKVPNEEDLNFNLRHLITKICTWNPTQGTSRARRMLHRQPPQRMCLRMGPKEERSLANTTTTDCNSYVWNDAGNNEAIMMRELPLFNRMSNIQPTNNATNAHWWI